jgi:hypothetical protein
MFLDLIEIDDPLIHQLSYDSGGDYRRLGV